GLQLVITLVKVGSLLLIIVLPFLALLWLSNGTRAADPERLKPAWPSANQLGFSLLGGFASALLAAQWAYHGWQNIAPVAEEIKEPQRNIPRSLLIGTAIVVALYLGANLADSLVLEQRDMTLMTDDPAAQRTAEEEGRPHA